MKQWSGHRNARRNIGHTLIEIIVASTIFLGATSIAYMGFSVVSRNFHHQSADVEIRQKARVAIDNMSQYLRMAQYIYAGQTVTIEGVNYVVPDAGAEGYSLVFASPENGNSGSITYTVVGYFLRDRTTVDPANPTAKQLMMYKKTGITPPTTDLPSSIVLSGLSGGSFRMIGDYYVRSDGLSFTLGSTAKTVAIHLSVEKRSLTNMPLVEEELYTQVTLRNFQ